MFLYYTSRSSHLSALHSMMSSGHHTSKKKNPHFHICVSPASFWMWRLTTDFSVLGGGNHSRSWRTGGYVRFNSPWRGFTMVWALPSLGHLWGRQDILHSPGPTTGGRSGQAVLTSLQWYGDCCDATNWRSNAYRGREKPDLCALPLHLVDGACCCVFLPRTVPFHLSLPLSRDTSGV